MRRALECFNQIMAHILVSGSHYETIRWSFCNNLKNAAPVYFLQFAAPTSLWCSVSEDLEDEEVSRKGRPALVYASLPRNAMSGW